MYSGEVQRKCRLLVLVLAVVRGDRAVYHNKRTDGNFIIPSGICIGPLCHDFFTVDRLVAVEVGGRVEDWDYDA